VTIVRLAAAGLLLATGLGQHAATLTWAKPDHFWYRRAVAGGHVWVTVDGIHGVRQPLFDHQRLAIELNLRTGSEYTPLTLPFADPAAEFVVKYDGSNAYIQEGALAIEFVLNGHRWRCELEKKWDWNKVPPTDYECLAGRAVDPERTVPAARDLSAVAVPSPDGRWVALVQNHNVVLRSASSGSSRALSSDGTASDAYQPASIRWSADSSSLTAYKVSEAVWNTDSVFGTVKQHVVRGSWRLNSQHLHVNTHRDH
jgi:hypothetical protein